MVSSHQEMKSNVDRITLIAPISILPLGSLEEPFLARLSERLQATLGHSVTILPRELEPGYAFNPRRRQYLSSDILKEIVRKRAKGPGKIMGITDVDLYATGLNFVFGEAHLSGHAAVVSLARLRPSFYGLAENNELLFRRAIKESVHELGHTYGLAHCSDRGCVMSFSNSIRDVDLKGEDFCQSCKRQYEQIAARIEPL
jgi:archaemetzincin